MRRALTLSLFVSASLPAMALAESFKLTDLTLGVTGTYFNPTDMNSFGDVSGYYSNSRMRPFRFFQGAFEELPVDASYLTGEAYSINDQGMTAGRATFGAWADSKPVYWNGVAAPTIITASGYIGSDLTGCRITNVSDGRFLIAVRSNLNHQNSYIGNFTTGQTNAVIQTPGEAGETTQVMDINAAGTFVGKRDGQSTGSFSVGMLGAVNGPTLTAIQDFRPYPAGGATLNSINSAGDAVGSASGETIDPRSRAILRRADGSVLNLGLGGGIYSWANDIDDAGHIVGAWSDASYRTYGCLFSTTGAPRDLNTLVTVPAGYRIVEAMSVNPAGQILVRAQYGTGSLNKFAWRLDPVAADQHLGAVGNFQNWNMPGWHSSTTGTVSITADPTVSDEEKEMNPDFNRVVTLITGSPVSITTAVNTPADPFVITFQYRMEESAGQLMLSLAGNLLYTIDGGSTPADTWLDGSFAVTDPALRRLLLQDLTFTYEAESAGKTVYLDNIMVAVPEPAVLGLLASLGLLSRRRRRA